MRFIHTSDLHIGKKINQISMQEQQEDILNQIISYCLQYKIDGLLIAGDIYDKIAPSAQAVEMIDIFFTRLSKENIKTYIIAGNHDNSQRLGFVKQILKLSNINICSEYSGAVDKYIIKDEFGAVNIYLLPFIRLGNILKQLESQDLDIDNSNDMIEYILKNESINTEERNVILVHQFVAGWHQSPEQSESEINPIGGLDSVDYNIFDSFDYVAMGHLHKNQRMGRDGVEYSGSPIKYSFSEARKDKYVNLITMESKGNIKIEKLILTPKNDMRIIKGKLDELIENALEQGKEDYIKAILTDKTDIFDAIGKLRTVYPNIMSIEIERKNNSMDIATPKRNNAINKDPKEMFRVFYEIQNGIELTENQLNIFDRLFSEVEK